MTRAEWKAEYVRLALASGHDITEQQAREDADAAIAYWDSERGRNPLPDPADALREDMREWSAA